MFKDKKIRNAQKMSFTDDLMDNIINFVLQLIGAVGGVVDMISSIGRKKRSILSDVLLLENE